MASQAPVNRMEAYYAETSKNPADGPGPEVPLQRARQLGSHLLELGELQGRLLLADTKAAWRRLLWFAILAIVGGVVLLATVPVALHALGLFFAAQFDWSLSAGLALAAGIALVVGAVLLAVAVTIVRAGIAKFNRSTGEFRENFALLKSLVSQSPRSE